MTLDFHRAHVLSAKKRTSDIGPAAADVPSSEPAVESSCSTFVGLLLSDPVLAGLAEAGYQRPSPIQQEAIPRGKCGLDLIVQAKSGTGKTCVLAAVALEQLLSVLSPAAATSDTVSMTSSSWLRCQSVVLAPTREVVLQVASVVRAIGCRFQGLCVCTFIGGTPMSTDIANCKQCHIAVASPGRLKHLIESGHLNTDSVRLFVMDEADKLMENTFIDDINFIYTKLPTDKQMLTLSATYTEQMAQQLSRYMLSPTFVRLNTQNQSLLGVRHFVVDAVSSPDLVLSLTQQQQSKLAALHQLLSSIEFTQCLVFCNYQTRAESVAVQLRERLGWPSAHLSAALDQQVRGQLLARLQQMELRVLVATDLAARGIDSQHVDLVVNWDVAVEAATLLHRSGRAGRYGSFGMCVTLVTRHADAEEVERLRALAAAARVKLYRLDMSALISGGSSSCVQLMDAELSQFAEYFSDTCTSTNSVISHVNGRVDISSTAGNSATSTVNDENGQRHSSDDYKRGMTSSSLQHSSGRNNRKVLQARRRIVRTALTESVLDSAGYQAASDSWCQAVSDKVTRSRDCVKSARVPSATIKLSSSSRGARNESVRYDDLLETYRMEQLSREAREYSGQGFADVRRDGQTRTKTTSHAGELRSSLRFNGNVHGSKPAGGKSNQMVLEKNGSSKTLSESLSNGLSSSISQSPQHGDIFADQMVSSLNSCSNGQYSATDSGVQQLDRGGKNCVASNPINRFSADDNTDDTTVSVSITNTKVASNHGNIKNQQLSVSSPDISQSTVSSLSSADKSQSTVSSRSSAVKSQSTVSSLSSAVKSQSTVSSLSSADKSQSTVSSLSSADKSQSTVSSLSSADKSQSTVSSLSSAEKSHSTVSALSSADKSQSTVSSLSSADKSQPTAVESLLSTVWDPSRIITILSSVRQFKCGRAESLQLLTRYLSELLKSSDRSKLYSQCIKQAETAGVAQLLSHILYTDCDSLSLRLLEEKFVERESVLVACRAGCNDDCCNVIPSGLLAPGVSLSSRVNTLRDKSALGDEDGSISVVPSGDGIDTSSSSRNGSAHTGTSPIITRTLPAITGTLPTNTRTLPANTGTLPTNTRTLPANTGTTPINTGTTPVNIETTCNRGMSRRVPAEQEAGSSHCTHPASKNKSTLYKPSQDMSALLCHRISPLSAVTGSSNTKFDTPSSSPRTSAPTDKATNNGRVDTATADADDRQVGRIERTEEDLISFQLELRRSLASKAQHAQSKSAPTSRHRFSHPCDDYTDDDDDYTDDDNDDTDYDDDGTAADGGDTPVYNNNALNLKHVSRLRNNTAILSNVIRHPAGMRGNTDYRATTPNVVSHSEIPRANSCKAANSCSCFSRRHPHTTRYGGSACSRGPTCQYPENDNIGLTCSWHNRCCHAPPEHSWRYSRSYTAGGPPLHHTHCTVDGYHGALGARSLLQPFVCTNRYDLSTCDGLACPRHRNDYSMSDQLMQRCYQDQVAYMYHMMSFINFK